MALKLEFKSGEKMIINGAVIENVGSHARLLVHNRANIMRGREILTAEESQTPAARTYFALQCAYLFPEHRETNLQQFNQLLADYLRASPSAQPIADAVRAAIEAGDLYKALRETHGLVKHELNVLQAFYQSLEQDAEEPTDDVDATDEDDASAAKGKAMDGKAQD